MTVDGLSETAQAADRNEKVFGPSAAQAARDAVDKPQRRRRRRRRRRFHKPTIYTCMPTIEEQPEPPYTQVPAGH